jgi:hypothetical protein
MVFHTNRIEVPSPRSKQDIYNYIYNSDCPGDARLDDGIEASNHFRMLDLVIGCSRQPLTIDLIKEYHRLLKTGTAAA